MTDKPDFARIAEEKLPCFSCGEIKDSTAHLYYCPAAYRRIVAAALREMWEQGREQGISDVYAGKDKP